MQNDPRNTSFQSLFFVLALFMSVIISLKKTIIIVSLALTLTKFRDIITNLTKAARQYPYFVVPLCI